MRAVGDVYGARGVRSDVIAERVRAGQRDAAFSDSRLQVKALQRAPCITPGCRSAQRTQVVRARPERARRFIREDSQDRARARRARMDEYGALGCAWLDTHDSTIPQAPDEKSTIGSRCDALRKRFCPRNGN